MSHDPLGEFIRFRMAVVVGLLAGCGGGAGSHAGTGGMPGVGGAPGLGGAPGTDDGQPLGWDQGIRVPVAVDINPDPNVVEVSLTAQVTSLSLVPGGPTDVWTYDGLLPGPLIRARQGNRVIVHFANQLPEDTTIHWHGLRVPAAMDGMPGESQPPTVPGGTFDYDFIVPDASTFWYHPHVNSAKQVGDGLYGPFIVDDPTEPSDVGDEVVMVLSDINIGADGKLGTSDGGGDLGTLFGREGDVLLVNGKVRPTLKARPGRPQRWRLINAAKARYFQVSLPGHSFTRIGGDGGLMTSPVTTDMPVLAPAERADLIVVPTGNSGDELVVRWIPYDRGWGTAVFREPADLFVVHLEGTPVTTPALPSLHREIVPLPLEGATPVTLSLDQVSLSPLVLGINGVAFSDAPTYHASVGETQIWTITNTIDWNHPFHLHGFFFQVLTEDLKPREPMEWKDTIDVGVRQTVRFAVKFDDRPGMWMFHCHLLDHAEAGMMAGLMVDPADAPAAGHAH